MDERTPVAPGRAPAIETLAVQHVERCPERLLGLRVVRIPPARTHAPAIGIDVAHLHVLVQAVLPARATEARRLHAAPWHLARAERVAEVVHPHHPRVDAPRNALALRDVARPH